MELAEYARIAEAEDSHWWYAGTRALMRELLAERLGAGMRVLDAGCGPGGNSAWLLPYGEVVGVDVASEALRLARQRHPEMRVLEGDIAALPFPERSFDLVLVVTVLTSVEDDAGAVREVARVLRPGGAALVLEPAMPALRREHDRVVHSRRRYRLGELRELAAQAGLEVRRSTYAYSFLVPPAAALAAWDRVTPAAGADSSDLERQRLGWIFGRLAAAERRLLRRRDLPLGLSAVVVAEKS